MLRLLRNSLALSAADSFFSALLWIISFLNSFSLISLSRDSFSLSFRMISFFSSSSFRLAHSASRFASFYAQTRSVSLCSVSSFTISDSISEIISMVTMLVLPLRIFSLFSLIFSSISLSLLPLVTVRSWVFSSIFSFSAVLAARVLHSSFIFASWARVFSTFCLYFSSLGERAKALACSFRTLRKEVRSLSRVLSSVSRARTAFSVSITVASSCTYSFSFLTTAISARNYWILISWRRASRRFRCVSRSPSSPSPVPYFFLNFSCERISSICSASSRACRLSLRFCSTSRSLVCSLLSSGLRQAELLGQLCPARSLTERSFDCDNRKFFSLPILSPFSEAFILQNYSEQTIIALLQLLITN